MLNINLSVGLDNFEQIFLEQLVIKQPDIGFDDLIFVDLLGKLCQHFGEGDDGRREVGICGFLHGGDSPLHGVFQTIFPIQKGVQIFLAVVHYLAQQHVFEAGNSAGIIATTT